MTRAEITLLRAQLQELDNAVQSMAEAAGRTERDPDEIKYCRKDLADLATAHRYAVRDALRLLVAA